MKYSSFQKLHTAIDIGTTKICVIIAHETAPCQFEILGIGIAPSQGLAQGVVVDITKASQALKCALKEASTMASVEPESACIGVSGSHIKSYYSQGMATVKQNVIRSQTVEDAINAAKAIPLSDDQQILHVVPVKYIVDGIALVENPLGMHGMRLEIGAHIITGSVGSVHNLISCCELAGIKVSDVVLEPIASAHALLSEDEKKLGVLMLDIGGGTADAALYHQGTIQYTEIFPIAGNVFTQDLAICLRTTTACAEEIKRISSIYANEKKQMCEVKNLQDNGTHEISDEFVSLVLHARAHELLTMLSKTIQNYHMAYSLPSGIVLTGGGALLKGIDTLAYEITGLNARIGIPLIAAHFKGPLEHPSFATAYGLLIYSAQKNASNEVYTKATEGPLFTRLFWKMRSWIDALV